MHEGKVFVNIAGSKTEQITGLNTSTEQAALLHELEQWLNDEVATEAYKKFKVGLRVHLSFGTIKNKNRGRKI